MKCQDSFSLKNKIEIKIVVRCSCDWLFLGLVGLLHSALYRSSKGPYQPVHLHTLFDLITPLCI